jgi:formylglycine-generating enzyme required for sulfatase activity
MKDYLLIAVLGLSIMYPLSGGEPKRLVADDTDPQTLKLLKTFNDEFVAITPGEKDFPASFVMGSETGPAPEQPAHKVTFRHKFSIARYEVPQNLYEAVMGENPSKWKGARNSAEMFSFAEAQEFCKKITLPQREASGSG